VQQKLTWTVALPWQHRYMLQNSFAEPHDCMLCDTMPEGLHAPTVGSVCCYAGADCTAETQQGN